MSANILTSKYMVAKQAMIDSYRSIHKPPAYITFSEVQDLQDAMQSAAVELAEYMVSMWSNEPQLPVSSVTEQAVDEILSEEDSDEDYDEDYEEECGCGGDPYCYRCYPVEKPYFPSFDITEDDLPSRIDRFEAEHPEWQPTPHIDWLDPVPDSEEDIKERAILADMKATEDAAWHEAATELELAGQSSDSRDLKDFFDEDDDEDYY